MKWNAKKTTVYLQYAGYYSTDKYSAYSLQSALSSVIISLIQTFW